MRDAAGVLSERAVQLVESAEKCAGAMSWPREALRAERAAVVGAALKLAGRRLLDGGRRDRLTGRVIAPAVAAIRSGETDPKRFGWSGVEVSVTAQRVEIRSGSHG
jgi:hypothetical protein